MHPIPAVRRTGRRLGVLLLTLVAVCGLLYGNAAQPAHAESSQRWTIITWHAEALSVDDNYPTRRFIGDHYRQMASQLRAAAGHSMDGSGNSSSLLDTPRERTNRIIEVQVWTHDGMHLALYFSRDNLYLLGYTNRGAHWRFSDTDNTLAAEYHNRYPDDQNWLFQSLGYNGNYNTLDREGHRANANYDRITMDVHLDEVSHTRQGRTNNVRYSLAYVIGATAEAARFGWIQERIATVLDHGSDPTDPNHPMHLGAFGIGLQNSWSDLSRLAHEDLGDFPTRPVRIDGRNYTNVNEINYGSPSLPRVAPFLALFRSGRGG
ncbi:ribosome-inactivating family protein [Streptomyces chrestomyceticus]|uniref:ribosome-inactivating family protein n=1 Tax=Streptomyces chrestomyceticus TaxID=68185 RepID=UPI0036CA0D41